MLFFIDQTWPQHFYSFLSSHPDSLNSACIHLWPSEPPQFFVACFLLVPRTPPVVFCSTQSPPVPTTRAFPWAGTRIRLIDVWDDSKGAQWDLDLETVLANRAAPHCGLGTTVVLTVRCAWGHYLAGRLFDLGLTRSIPPTVSRTNPEFRYRAVSPCLRRFCTSNRLRCTTYSPTPSNSLLHTSAFLWHADVWAALPVFSSTTNAHLTRADWSSSRLTK